MPAAFDAPLAAHHKLIGQWAAALQPSDRRFTRPEARHYIERTFEAAALEALSGCELADLRIVVLLGDENLPPALAIVCDTIGQIDLGWIEKSNVLSDTLFGHVAPVGWRAAGYKAIVETMGIVLPAISYADLFDEIAQYYWDGATDDDEARRVLIEYHGADPADMAELTLPSEMAARRPDFMLAENASPLKDLPPGLRERIRGLRRAYRALAASGSAGDAWRGGFHAICEYLPEFEDRTHLPPLTLVPFDHFARELDDVARHGMEMGFMDVVGFCPLRQADDVDAWLGSLRLGAELILAVQALIDFDPAAGGTQQAAGRQHHAEVRA